MKAYFAKLWQEELEGATFLRECLVELVPYACGATLFVAWLGSLVGLFMLHA